MTGGAVPEGFRLPWNTTRSMADVWSKSEQEKRLRRELREQADAAAKWQPKGKLAYAGRGK